MLVGALFVPCGKALLLLGIIFDLYPTMAQREWILLDLLEVLQSLGNLCKRYYNSLGLFAVPY
jgi:hypothetical protein